MDAKSLPALNGAVNRLTTMLVTKQDELHRRETSQGTAHDVQKMNQLRIEIASIEKRLSLAERLQNDVICGGK
jgi:hypothetical protein